MYEDMYCTHHAPPKRVRIGLDVSSAEITLEHVHQVGREDHAEEPDV